MTDLTDRGVRSKRLEDRNVHGREYSSIVVSGSLSKLTVFQCDGRTKKISVGAF